MSSPDTCGQRRAASDSPEPMHGGVSAARGRLDAYDGAAGPAAVHPTGTAAPEADQERQGIMGRFFGLVGQAVQPNEHACVLLHYSGKRDSDASGPMLLCDGDGDGEVFSAGHAPKAIAHLYAS